MKGEADFIVIASMGNGTAGTCGEKQSSLAREPNILPWSVETSGSNSMKRGCCSKNTSHLESRSSETSSMRFPETCHSTKTEGAEREVEFQKEPAMKLPLRNTS